MMSPPDSLHRLQFMLLLTSFTFSNFSDFEVRGNEVRIAIVAVIDFMDVDRDVLEDESTDVTRLGTGSTFVRR